MGTCSVTRPLREITATAGINVLVAPCYRRQGWGRRLLEHAESVTWADTCPEELVAEYAVFKNRMSTDVPTAGLGGEAEDWDPARVREEERTSGRGGVQVQVAAARHHGTGRLVACTVLNWRAGVPATITQQDTLVAAEHRGKGLGLLVKTANLRAAQERWPAARSVLTWNAVENRHMLAINITLGFKPAGYEGEWQKRLG